ncbi:hypothetical protein [Arthrobacter sp. 754]|uniref:hypothetical protein n=1 Tax=Arthrobacter sp. 754 TaxID=3156315 RepID=UPI003393D49F
MSDTAGSMRNTAGHRSGGPENDAAVDRLLLEAELDDDGGLRAALVELRSLSVGQPVPSDAVAALMVPAANAPRVAAVAAVARTSATPAPAEALAAVPAEAPVDELAARRRAKRRITMTTLSVAVSLAAGGAVAVASDQGIRDAIGALNHTVTSFVAGAGGASPDKTGQAPPSDPTQPGGAASVPVPGTPEPSAPGAQPATSPASGADGQAAAPAQSTLGAVPPGATLPDNLAGIPVAGVPGAGEPLNGAPLNGGPLNSGPNGGPLDEAAPGLPVPQPLPPLPITQPPGSAPASGQ